MLIISEFAPIALILFGSALAVIWQKIDLLGGILGALVTYLLFKSIGFLGIALIGVFFLIGTIASVYKINQKEEFGVAQVKSSKRGWRNVLANSGVAALIAIADIIFPEFDAAALLIASSFSVALSDTLSSELGNIMGRRYFNIITLKPSKRGKDGAVSWVGFSWGILGSCFVGLVHWLFTDEVRESVLVMMLGFGGNVIDSLLGATLQQMGYLDNHFVNFVSNLLVIIIFLIFIYQ